MTSHERPAYMHDTIDEQRQKANAEMFARQVMTTCGPWLSKPAHQLDVLDLGSGYGHTADALAQSCRSVLGIEPAGELYRFAEGLALARNNLGFRQGGVEDITDVEAFDLVILDNVYEHLPDHALALDRISRALRPGGVLYLLVPNRLWPIEAHYKLPFLSWLPVPLANRYLRWTGRGTDYTDASYAPTYRGLARELRARPELTWQFVLPGDPDATRAGTPAHYRLGMWLLRRYPSMWSISKALLVVAVKKAPAPGR